jgi:archaellum component FlaC
LPLDPRRLSQTLTESTRRLESMKRDATSVTNDIARLGQEFRNDKRFSKDSYSLSSEIRELERAIEKVKDRLSSINRNNR